LVRGRTGIVGVAWDADRVAARKGSAPKLGDVLLVTGAESFLADRAVRSAIAAVSKNAASGDGAVEVTDLEASTLDVGVFAELTGPSLFASERVLVLRGLENLPAEMAPHLIEYAGSPADDVLVVLVHSGGQKGKGVLDKLRKASVNEVVATAPKTWELPQFVAGRSGCSAGPWTRARRRRWWMRSGMTCGRWPGRVRSWCRIRVARR